MALFGKPRLARLGELALRAELLRRRRQVRGYALRAVSGAAAAVFAVLMLLWLQVAAWALLARAVGPVAAAAAIVFLDLALCSALAWAAARRADDAIERAARSVRDDALRAARAEATGLGGLLRPSGGSPPRSRRVRVYEAVH